MRLSGFWESFPDFHSGNGVRWKYPHFSERHVCLAKPAERQCFQIRMEVRPGRRGTSAPAHSLSMASPSSGPVAVLVPAP